MLVQVLVQVLVLVLVLALVLQQVQLATFQKFGLDRMTPDRSKVLCKAGFEYGSSSGCQM